MAVVYLVRVEHDNPPRCACPRRAAVVEALKPRFGDANRIGLVPVTVIGMTSGA